MKTLADNSLSIDYIRDLEPSKRRPYIRRLRFMYPRARKILDELRYCLTANEYSVDPKCKILVPSGTGKSTLLNILMEENPRTFTETETVVPVFMATVDSPATVGSFASRLLEGIGDPGFSVGTIANRMYRVERFIKHCRTQMVLIDEIQHFVDRDKNRIVQTVSDALKNLIKNQHLACILSGLEGEAEKVVDSNPQLARLFSDPLVLDPFVWDEKRPETIGEFRRFLKEAEDSLPLQNKSNLTSFETAYRFFVATGGLMAFMMILREGTMLALDRGLESLDLELLGEVFNKELSKNRRGLKNPFVGELPEYKIVSNQKAMKK